jgi:aspartokinase/homoserine dehydrogenase 1
MQVSASAQEFMQKLPKFNQELSKKQEDADFAGEVCNN